MKGIRVPEYSERGRAVNSSEQLDKCSRESKESMLDSDPGFVSTNSLLTSKGEDQ